MKRITVVFCVSAGVGLLSGCSAAYETADLESKCAKEFTQPENVAICKAEIHRGKENFEAGNDDPEPLFNKDIATDANILPEKLKHLEKYDIRIKDPSKIELVLTRFNDLVAEVKKEKNGNNVTFGKNTKRIRGVHDPAYYKWRNKINMPQQGWHVYFDDARRPDGKGWDDVQMTWSLDKKYKSNSVIRAYREKWLNAMIAVERYKKVKGI